MNRLYSLQEKLKMRKPILGTTIGNVAWTGLVQKAASFPFDFMMFDIEHGTLSIESIEEALRICRLCDLPSIVRIPDSIPNLISKTLDMGADGILLPRVETLAQVETAIRAARYYPRGRKGCGGFSNLRAEDQGSVATYNENRMIFIQMESCEGLAVLPEILDRYATEISGVIIGPYDSSIMVGTPLIIGSETMLAYIKNVFDTCSKSGMPCGIFVDDETLIERYRMLGCNIFWTGTELSLLCGAYQRLCDTYSKIMK